MENFTIERNNDCVVVTFSGEITLEVTGTIKEQLENALHQAPFTTLVVDLADIGFMDSSGIGFLVALNTRIMGQGRKMFLYRPSQQVRKTLSLVQLASFFKTLESEDELLTL